VVSNESRMRVFIHKSGEQLGPFTREEALAKEQQGEIAGEDKAWADGEKEWVSFQALKEQWRTLAIGANTQGFWTRKRVIVGSLLLIVLIAIVTSKSGTPARSRFEVIQSRLTSIGFTLTGPERQDTLALWHGKNGTVDILLYFNKDELAIAAVSIVALQEGQILTTDDPDAFIRHGRAIDAVIGDVVSPSDIRTAINWHLKAMNDSKAIVGSENRRKETFGGFLFTSICSHIEVDGKFGELPVTCRADHLVLEVALKKK
jgi:hypothetical protein